MSQVLKAIGKLYVTTYAKTLKPRPADYGSWTKSSMPLIYSCPERGGRVNIFKDLVKETKGEYFSQTFHDVQLSVLIKFYWNTPLPLYIITFGCLWAT